MPSAIAVIALAERGTMFDPGPIVYMEKMAVGDRFADLLDLDRPLGRTVELIAERKETDVNDVMAVVLDRPRHAEGIEAIRQAGGRVQLITDGDVSGALNAVSPDRKVDFLWGIGGTPEGVITAAAVKCLGGALVGRLHPRDDDERKAATDAGYDLDRVLDPRRPGPRRGRLLLRHRRDRRRRAAGRPLRGRAGGEHRVAGHALALRHRAAHPVAPRPRQAAPAHGLRGRLSVSRLTRGGTATAPW